MNDESRPEAAPLAIDSPSVATPPARLEPEEPRLDEPKLSSEAGSERPEETPYERRLWAAQVVSRDLLTVETLAYGEPVPTSALESEWRRLLGLSADDFVLDDAAARRIELLRREHFVRDPADEQPAPAAAERSRFVGLTFAEARITEIPTRSELVKDVVDVGTFGLFSGLPFARKTFAAGEMAEKIAYVAALRAAGETDAANAVRVFGRFPVLVGGPVVYVWQDDGTAKMLERIQAKARRSDYPDTLPLRYLLNEGVRLPDDLPALRDLVLRDGAVLLVLDSIYNFLSPSVGLKEEGVAAIIAETKRAICDETGCTVAGVDHAPWPTESNRGQRRAYGSVFKTAAVRWTIYLEADSKDDTRLHIEASGNNVSGFRRTPAYFDADTLEIHLVDAAQPDHEALDAAVLEHITSHPGDPQKTIEDAVEGSRDSIRKALERLSAPGDTSGDTPRIAQGPGRHPRGKYWYPAHHAALHSPGDTQANLGDIAPGAFENGHSPNSPATRRVGESSGESFEAEIERLADAARDAQEEP